MSERTADQVLDESFLEVRAKLLEVAATLDRIERVSESGEGLSEASISRRAQLDEAMRIILGDGQDRAERLQLLFSRPYEARWREQLNV